LKLFLEFGNTGRPESVLIQTSLELLQLEIGTGTLFFSADYLWWGPLATPCWLKSLWAFVFQAQVWLVDSSSPLPLLPHQNDAYFMDEVVKMNLPAAEFHAVNQCCLAHKILFVSDIMDGWGASLHEPLLRHPCTSPVNCWQWPHATTINADWIVWNQCLLCLAASVVIGPWIHSPHLSDFIPFDLPLSTAFVKGAGNFWY